MTKLKNLKGAKELSKKEQQEVKGGRDLPTCSDLGNQGVDWDIVCSDPDAPSWLRDCC